MCTVCNFSLLAEVFYYESRIIYRILLQLSNSLTLNVTQQITYKSSLSNFFKGNIGRDYGKEYVSHKTQNLYFVLFYIQHVLKLEVKIYECAISKNHSKENSAALYSLMRELDERKNQRWKISGDCPFKGCPYLRIRSWDHWVCPSRSLMTLTTLLVYTSFSFCQVGVKL